ncbi:MAG: hypothetical protein QM784_17535 [Polyangiaceae bacterium]
MASTKKKTTSKKAPAKKPAAKQAAVEKTAGKKTAGKKTRAKKAPVAEAETKKTGRGKGASKEMTERTITATVTLAGSPDELKSCVEEIVEAAKKVLEKELRKQIKQA